MKNKILHLIPMLIGLLATTSLHGAEVVVPMGLYRSASPDSDMGEIGSRLAEEAENNEAAVLLGMQSYTMTKRKLLEARLSGKRPVRDDRPVGCHPRGNHAGQRRLIAQIRKERKQQQTVGARKRKLVIPDQTAFSPRESKKPRLYERFVNKTVRKQKARTARAAKASGLAELLAGRIRHYEQREKKRYLEAKTVVVATVATVDEDNGFKPLVFVADHGEHPDPRAFYNCRVDRPWIPRPTAAWSAGSTAAHQTPAGKTASINLGSFSLLRDLS